jgi:DNA-binding NtrC family response regulator
MPTQRILIVDDKPTMRSLFERILPDHDVTTASDGAKALMLLDAEGEFDVIVSDIRMPKLDGISLLKEVKRRAPETEVILMTAYAEVEDAVQAMKAGAFDYLIKPFDPDVAVLSIEKALEVRRLRHRTRRLQEELDLARGFGPFVGSSAPMQDVYALVTKAAASELNVLISGDSGTGKELVARSIHQRGARSENPFVVINCGAVPRDLAESEIFGHVKGAFTGAIADKPGLVEEASGGTLFLDEINSLPLELQVKLNRAIEEREGRRVGANASYSIDVRLIAATNANLQEEVEAGRFREDLYYRLNVLQLPLPPLRKRKDDIVPLVTHFLEQASADGPTRSFAPEALKLLLRHSWPGNVRELRNAVESAVAVADGETIRADDLPGQVVNSTLEDEMPAAYLATLTYQEACDVAREQALKRYFHALLQEFQGNVTGAAEHAEISREALHRLLRKHGITPSDYRG